MDKQNFPDCMHVFRKIQYSTTPSLLSFVIKYSAVRYSAVRIASPTESHPGRKVAPPVRYSCELVGINIDNRKGGFFFICYIKTEVRLVKNHFKWTVETEYLLNDSELARHQNRKRAALVITDKYLVAGFQQAARTKTNRPAGLGSPARQIGN